MKVLLDVEIICIVVVLKLLLTLYQIWIQAIRLSDGKQDDFEKISTRQKSTKNSLVGKAINFLHVQYTSRRQRTGCIAQLVACQNQGW